MNNDFIEIEENHKITDENIYQKEYYKLLYNHYLKFLKKINFHNPDTETTCNTQNTTQKRKKEKNTLYDIIKMNNNLYKNIKIIKKCLFSFSEKYDKNILIIDGENILKSYKIQQILKLHLTDEEFNNYFYFWFNGISENSIQSYTTLNISLHKKILLLNILLENYLFNYNNIIIISTNTKLDFESEHFYNINNNIFISIIYNKEDTREQDDYLLLYIYYHFHNNNKECQVISGDKFRWFKHTDNYLKNFFLQYDLSNYKIKLLISDSYSNDEIITNNFIYKVGYYYFPFIKNFSLIVNINKDFFNNNFVDFIIENINNENYDIVLNNFFKIFLLLIEYNFYKDEKEITFYTNLLILLISKISKDIINAINHNICILSKLANIGKKIISKNNNYLILYKLIFNIINNTVLSDLSNPTFSSISNNDEISVDFENSEKLENLEYTKFCKNIKKYFFTTELYLILKSISFLVNSNKYIIKISKFFSIIMKVFDIIEDNIFKIRKISNDNNFFNKLFLNILSHHIFIKKSGFCKRDY
jgi:hypothetical protein